MSLSIGGMSNPFLRTNQVNPLNKGSSVQQTQNQGQDQGQQVQDKGDAKPAQKLGAEEQEEQLKKYSKSMYAYGLAMVNMQNGGKGMIGTETCGSVG